MITVQTFGTLVDLKAILQTVPVTIRRRARAILETWTELHAPTIGGQEPL